MEARKEKIVECECGCGSRFLHFDSKGRARHFVSGHNMRINNPNKKDRVQQICKGCGKLYYKSPSLANRGKNNYCSNKCRYKDSYSWLGGNKNVNWKGGFNGVQNLRWCPEYNEWRKSVFKRDRYKCQECLVGFSRHNPLHAHHLIKFSEDFERAFLIENGKTLCKKCHLKIHTKQIFVKNENNYSDDQHTFSLIQK